MISGHDQARIAVQAIVCQRTVLRVYQGRGSTYSRRRVAEAAKVLGIAAPPGPVERRVVRIVPAVP